MHPSLQRLIRVVVFSILILANLNALQKYAEICQVKTVLIPYLKVIAA